MKLFACSVRDSASDSFGSPLCFVARGQAMRWFSDAVNNPDKENLYYQHPEDYEMFHVGVFDTDTGSFESCVPESVVRGKDVQIVDLTLK